MGRTKTSGRLPPEWQWRPFLIEPAAKLDWRVIFGNDRPVEVEIGSGKGLFLAGAAEQSPAHNFVGIEIARKYAQFAAGRLARHSLSNARMICADARKIITEWIPDASVSALHVYFPDPWWKRRHKKRRIFTDDLLRQICRVLVATGELRIASDVPDYFEQMQAIIADAKVFQPIDLEPPAAGANADTALTNFERKYRKVGKPIWRANYRLV